LLSASQLGTIPAMAVDVAQLTGPLADRGAWSAHDRCSIGRAMEVVGTRSAMLLMREAFYGTRRFDDFAQRVGITEAVAAKRLQELVAAGLLERTPYRDPGQRTRHEYRLTGMGRDLVPAALALMQWGDRYLSGDDGGPLALRHADCGASVSVEVRCAQGHEVPLEEIAVEINRPGRA
jgi:DNA-binding HxlR family transcriptional regulator